MTGENFTRYEKARLLGARALQISLGAPIMVDAGPEDESIEVAIQEFEEEKLPLTVKQSEKKSAPTFPPI